MKAGGVSEVEFSFLKIPGLQPGIFFFCAPSMALDNRGAKAKTGRDLEVKVLQGP
jgi:hypothetical protein